MKKILVGLLILGLLLSGCTGWGTAPENRATLKDLYTTTGGLYAHAKIAGLLAAQARAGGARGTFIEMPIPYSRKRADFAAEYDRRDGLHLKVNEIKPINSRSGTPLDNALSQLGGYLTGLRSGGRYRTVSANLYFVAEPTPFRVPDSYTPELSQKCLELRLRTYENLAPGVVFYWFAHKNTDTCRRRNEEQIAADIAAWIFEVSNTTIPRNYRSDYARLRVAQIYADEEVAQLREVMFYPYGATQNPDQNNAPHPATRSDTIYNNLMDYTVPSWMRTQPTPWEVPIPGRDNGQTWSCTRIAC